ncbi:hypothetical protein J3R30DRAFT_3708135 [Lentinula aciculospora]|uniref:Uncharacterized protein n=1 Tax=Lentinula aciculospora TaxID=153920 RepID=A0A9W9DKC9_9AGAR|nr:hypothetical protein J3R30DRAFT_3708135 [Lentinula aciculospora]
MRVIFAFTSLILGIISTVSAEPLPVLERSTPLRITAKFTNVNTGIYRKANATDYRTYVQSLLNDQWHTMRVEGSYKINAEDVPITQQNPLIVEITGGTRCLPTAPCTATYGAEVGLDVYVVVTSPAESNSLVADFIQLEEYNSNDFT